MLYWLIGGIVLLGAALLLGQWFVRANPAVLAQRIRQVAGYGLAAVAVLAFLTGRIMPAMLLAAGAATLLGWRSLGVPGGGTSAGPSPGNTSQVDTQWLAMSLDHVSGGLDGSVKQGRFSGKRLGELSREQVIELYQECAGADPQSGTLLETYLDRLYPDWRGEGQQQQQEQETSRPPPRDNRMSRDEALRVLGLKPDAGPEEVREAHHRLMLKVHPDQGGSDYLAAKLNEAKDVLLGK